MNPSVECEPTDRADAQRFQVDVDGQAAFAQYRKAGGVITFTHTFVPEPLRGRGIATRLVEAGLVSARAARLTVVPQCSMVAAYMRDHPETHSLLDDDGRALLAGRGARR